MWHGDLSISHSVTITRTHTHAPGLCLFISLSHTSVRSGFVQRACPPLIQPKWKSFWERGDERGFVEDNISPDNKNEILRASQ